jgi:hypothetical protein
MSVYVIEDCKRCLLHLDLIRCVKVNEDWIEVQVLGMEGVPVKRQKRKVGRCVFTQEMVEEVAERYAERARRMP